MSGGDDDQEVGGEGPDDTSQRRQRLSEVEGAQHDVEAQQVGEDVPYVLRQPQMVGVEGLRERARGVVGRRDLVSRHSAEEVVHPARALARTLIIVDLLRAKALGSLGVVAEQHLDLGDGNEEIGKPDECEE